MSELTGVADVGPMDEQLGDDAAIVRRARAGARLLTARSVVMRTVSVGSNLILLALVSPVELGLFSVVYGLLGIVTFTTDLGVGRTLLRRPQPPGRAEFAALTGIQMVVIAITLFLFVAWPHSVPGLSMMDGRWFPWMAGTVATMILLPFAAGARVRLERALEYEKLAIVDVANVVIQNVGLLIFAAAGRFSIGVFVVFGAMNLITHAMLCYWSPGPGPSLRLTPLLAAARESAGYMAAGLLNVAKDRATPVLVASLFGLPTAGIWTFAVRLAHLLNITFLGFRQAAVPAAARLAAQRDRLRELAGDTLHGTAALAFPFAAIAFAGIPVIPLLWPEWDGAVELAQIYVLCYAVAGVAGATLEPVAVAVRGSVVALAEAFSWTVTGWAGLVVIHWSGRGEISWVIPFMSIATTLALLLLTDRSVRPVWRSATLPFAAALGAGLVAYAIGTVSGMPAVYTALFSTAASVAWLSPVRRLVGLQRRVARVARPFVAVER